MDDLTLWGIVILVLGVIIFAFPYVSQSFLAFILGLIFIIGGILTIVKGFEWWQESKGRAFYQIVIGIIAIVLGICLLGNVKLFDILFGLMFWIVGILMIVTGIIGLYHREYTLLKGSSSIMLILGVIIVLLGYFSLLSPIYVAVILGISLIIDGIALITEGQSLY